MTDPLLARALVHALHPEDGAQMAAVALARQAEGHPEALDRALAHLLRRASARPTAVTERAVKSLRLARALALEAADAPPAPASRPDPAAAPGPDYALGAIA